MEIDISQFYKNYSYKDGCQGICKKCDNKKRTKLNRKKKIKKKITVQIKETLSDDSTDESETSNVSIGYLYILREREFVRLDEKTYKIR